MNSDYLLRLLSEVMDDTDFYKDLPDHYDEQVGTVNKTIRDTHDITSHLDKQMIPDSLREQEMRKLCRERSKILSTPVGQHSMDEYGVITSWTRLDATLEQVIPEKVRHALLCHAHDPLLAVIRAADDCTTLQDGYAIRRI